MLSTELLQRIDGDLSLLSELLELFRGDFPGQIRALREALKNGDSANFQRIGHTLKGALGNLSAPHASHLAGEIESIGKSGEITVAESKVNDLECEGDRVIQDLQHLCMEAVQ